MTALALAAAGFIYRKKIVKALIEISSVSFFISEAAAQSPKISDPPPKAPEYRQVRDEGAVIEAKAGILGFELIGRMEKVLKSCEELTSPFYLGAFALADINDEDYYLKINACLKKEMDDKKYVLRYGAVQAPVTAKEKEMIEKVWASLKARNETLSIIDEELIEFKNEINDRSALAATLRRLEGWDHLVFLAAQMRIYAGLDNLGKVEELAKTFLEKPKVYSFYQMEYPYGSARSLREKLAKLLSKTHKSMGRNRLFEAFLMKVYAEATDEQRESLEDEMNLPLSSSKAEKIVKSPVLGLKTSLAWTDWARENLSKEKYESALEEIPVSVKPHNIAALKHYVPQSPDKREAMAKAFAKFMKNADPKERALAVEVLENENWRKYLTSQKDVKTPPLFRMKRELFSENFEQNRALLYSIYNLYLMGDFQRKHFVKLLALRSYGLPATFLLPIQ